jgi:hypothetical protein
MIKKFSVRLACYLLNRSDISIEDRNLLTTCLLDKLAALPLRDMITTNEEGNLLVSGRQIDIDIAKKLRESARAALNSYALNLVREQVTYESVVTGVHKALNADQILFGKAAIWCQQQEVKWLKTLAGLDGTNGNPTP